jgi:hypothetical protein
MFASFSFSLFLYFPFLFSPFLPFSFSPFIPFSFSPFLFFSFSLYQFYFPFLFFFFLICLFLFSYLSLSLLHIHLSVIPFFLCLFIFSFFPIFLLSSFITIPVSSPMSFFYFLPSLHLSLYFPSIFPFIYSYFLLATLSSSFFLPFLPIYPSLLLSFKNNLFSSISIPKLFFSKSTPLFFIKSLFILFFSIKKSTISISLLSLNYFGHRPTRQNKMTVKNKHEKSFISTDCILKGRPNLQGTRVIFSKILTKKIRINVTNRLPS